MSAYINQDVINYIKMQGLSKRPDIKIRFREYKKDIDAEISKYKNNLYKVVDISRQSWCDNGERLIVALKEITNAYAYCSDPKKNVVLEINVISNGAIEIIARDMLLSISDNNIEAIERRKFQDIKKSKGYTLTRAEIDMLLNGAQTVEFKSHVDEGKLSKLKMVYDVKEIIENKDCKLMTYRKRNEVIIMTDGVFILPIDSTILFSRYHIKNFDFKDFDTRYIKRAAGMFYRSKLDSLSFDAFKGKITVAADMFSHANIKRLDITNLDLSKTVNANKMFEYYNEKGEIIGLETLDTSSLRTAEYMLSYISNKSISNLDLTKWNISKLQKAQGMFRGSQFDVLNISGWKFEEDIDVDDWFTLANIMNLQMEDVDISNCKYTSSMFASSLIGNKYSLDKQLREAKGKRCKA